MNSVTITSPIFIQSGIDTIFTFVRDYNVPGPNALTPFFEARFARLKYIQDNQFNMAFMRYTGEWVEVYQDLSLEQCLAAVESDPFFHP